MKKYILNYYPAFKCVASECKHTCCAGWEMNIDEQSLSAYKTNQSPFSRTLKKGINFKKSMFRTDKNMRCAFLNQKGLCEIIINLGEQSLCQICRDHPRFRTFFNDRIETGLGFCCEEVAKIILSFEGKICPTLIDDDSAPKALDFTQTNILEFRKKALNIVQDRATNINERIDTLLSLCKARINCEDFAKILKTFYSFERMDKNWTARLKRVSKTAFTPHTDTSLAHYTEQFLANGLYRHLYDAEDTMWVRAKTVACIFGWWLIKSIFEQERTAKTDNFQLLVDVVRAYSAEVEYSQKNLDKLFSLAYKFIKL